MCLVGGVEITTKLFSLYKNNFQTYYAMIIMFILTSHSPVSTKFGMIGSALMAEVKLKRSRAAAIGCILLLLSSFMQCCRVLLWLYLCPEGAVQSLLVCIWMFFLYSMHIVIWLQVDFWGVGDDLVYAGYNLIISALWAILSIHIATGINSSTCNTANLRTPFK